LDGDAARAALEPLAAGMGLSLEAAARGIIDVANVNIDRALRRVSVARGYDPRDFTLVAFGGAGALHACAVAERLGILRVLVPRYPGVLCAFGLLAADVALDYSHSVLDVVTSETGEYIQAVIDGMALHALHDLRNEGIHDERQMRFEASLDVRYQGQAYELTIPFTWSIADAFHAAHERTYGHALRGRNIEVVNVRLQAIGLVDKPPLTPEPLVENDGSEALLKRRGDMSLYERERLHPGARFAGEALVFQLDSTVYVAAGWSARVDAYRNLILERVI
ncbi:MAG: hydantoinase/oxoprolinase family protein, partial [Burkholderiales bacterium]|nr:hydantoinase/oxoprolinase family protein [Anaerolineae bacterium]